MSVRRRVYGDTEFIPSVPGIRGLISIALSDMYGIEYYAVNADMAFGIAAATPWLRKNVLPHLPLRADGSLDMEHPAVKPAEVIADEIGRYFSRHQQLSELYFNYGAQDMVRMYDLWGNDWSKFPPDMPVWFVEIEYLIRRAGMLRLSLPEQAGGLHDALADARHNKLVHETLMKRADFEAWHPYLGPVWNLLSAAWFVTSRTVVRFVRTVLRRIHRSPGQP